jgi:exosome complex RNA-binding protein Rrp4
VGVVESILVGVRTSISPQRAISEALRALAVIACSVQKLLDRSVRAEQREGSAFLRAISVVTAEVQVATRDSSLKFLHASALSPVAAYWEMISLVQNGILLEIQPLNVLSLIIVSPTFSRDCSTVGALAFISMAVGVPGVWVFAGATSEAFPQAVRRMRVVAMRREVLRFIVGG